MIDQIHKVIDLNYTVHFSYLYACIYVPLSKYLNCIWKEKGKKNKMQVYMHTYIHIYFICFIHFLQGNTHHNTIQITFSPSMHVNTFKYVLSSFSFFSSSPYSVVWTEKISFSKIKTMYFVVCYFLSKKNKNTKKKRTQP